MRSRQRTCPASRSRSPRRSALEYAPFAVGAAVGPAVEHHLVPVPRRGPGADARDGRVELLVDLGFERSGPGFRSEGLAYTRRRGADQGHRAAHRLRPGRRARPRRRAGRALRRGGRQPAVRPAPSSPLGDPRDRAATTALPARPGRARGARRGRCWARPRRPGAARAGRDAARVLDPRRHEIRRALEDALDALDARTTWPARRAGRPARACAACSPPRPRASAHRVSAVGHAHIDSAWLWPHARDDPQVRPHVLQRRRRWPTSTRTWCSPAPRPSSTRGCRSTTRGVRAASQEGRRAGPVRAGRRHVGRVRHQHARAARRWSASSRTGKRFFAERARRRAATRSGCPTRSATPARCRSSRRLAGFRWFLTQKMSWNDTNVFPHHTFWWEGIDGTRVFTHFPPADTYNSELSGRGARPRACATSPSSGRATPFAAAVRLRRRRRRPDPGDDGDRAAGWPTWRARRGSTVGAPARVLRPRAEAEYPDAPVWAGEMYLEFHRGTYTSQAAMKQGNRRSEHLLREAELWCADRRAARRAATTRTTSCDAAVAAGAAAPVPRHPARQLDRLGAPRGARDATPSSRERAGRAVDAALAALAGDGRPGAGARQRGPARARTACPRWASAPRGRRRSRRCAVGARRRRACCSTTGCSACASPPDGTGRRSVRDLVAGREVLPPGPRQPAAAAPGHCPNQLRRVGHRRVLPAPPPRPDRRRRRSTSTTTDPARRDRRGAASATATPRYVQTIALAGRRAPVDFGTDGRLARAGDAAQGRVPGRRARRRGPPRRSSSATCTGRPTPTPRWDAARFEICAHRVGARRPSPATASRSPTTRTYGHDVTRRGPGDARGAGPTTVRLSLLRAPALPRPGRPTRAGTASATRLVVRRRHRRRGARGLPAEPAGARRCAAPGPVAPLVTVEQRRRWWSRRSSWPTTGPATWSCGSTSRAAGAGGPPCGRVVRRRRAVRVCDLLERDDPEVAALRPCTVAGGSARLDLGPFQVVTLRLSR